MYGEDQKPLQRNSLLVLSWSFLGAGGAGAVGVHPGCAGSSEHRAYTREY